MDTSLFPSQYRSAVCAHHSVSGGLKVVFGSDRRVFIAETVHTVQGKPCVNDSKIPYQGRCLRLPYRQLLEVKSSQERRKYKIFTELKALLECDEMKNTMNI